MIKQTNILTKHEGNDYFEELKDEPEFEYQENNLNESAPPKRPLSPYIFFSQEVRPFEYANYLQQRKILKTQHPHWSTKQVMRIISQNWQKMSKDEK